MRQPIKAGINNRILCRMHCLFCRFHIVPVLTAQSSSSMHFVFSYLQLAFESLATITNALTRLEAGEIAICRSDKNRDSVSSSVEVVRDLIACLHL